MSNSYIAHHKQDSGYPIYASSPTEAKQLQETLRKRVRIAPLPSQIKTIAGVDVSFNLKSNWGIGGVVVCDAETFNVLDSTTFQSILSFPYIPGFLSFRELPLILPAFEKLSRKPDLVLCDGQGFAHPRRFGLACHLGVALDCPSIGCAKSRLLGEHEEPGKSRGSQTPLRFEDEDIGVVLRTRTGVAPLYISIGHKITLLEAIDWTLRSAIRYRLPEPIRGAHELVNKIRQQISE